jgi:hypothetical protein
MYKTWRECLSPEGEGGAGGDIPTPAAPPAPAPAPAAPSPTPSTTVDDDDDDEPGGGSETRITESYQAALQRANNSSAMLAEQLWRENYKLRHTKRTLTTELNQFRNRLPEGAVVLSGEEATAFQTYQQLGKPGDLQAALEEKQRQAAELTALQRSGMLRQVADASGYVYEVLKTLDKPELVFEVEPSEQGPVAYVSYPTGQDDTRERKPLAEYAAANWKAFLPSLQPQGAPKVTLYPSQRLDDKAAKKDVAGNMIDKTYAQQHKNNQKQRQASK